MNLGLDHVFILVEPEAEVAELLVSLGMREGSSNIHKGQGTSNRRFYFSNGMLEFLWIRDADEAINGPGRELYFPERSKDSTASPFGAILTRKDNSSLEMPFGGWEYQPDYFSPPLAFHVGENSSNILEPLCIYVPFAEPGTSKYEQIEGEFQTITNVHIYTPSEPISNVMEVADSADRLSIKTGRKHLMEITFNDNSHGLTKDLRPDIPLIIHW